MKIENAKYVTQIVTAADPENPQNFIATGIELTDRKGANETCARSEHHRRRHGTRQQVPPLAFGSRHTGNRAKR